MSKGLQCKLWPERFWVVRSAPTSLQTAPVSSSAPRDITSFIILLHATQLRLTAFFGYNQAFMLILWWLSQTLDQTVAPQLTPTGRRIKEADNLPCELQNVTQWQLTEFHLHVVQVHKQLTGKYDWQICSNQEKHQQKCYNSPTSIR